MGACGALHMLSPTGSSCGLLLNSPAASDMAGRSVLFSGLRAWRHFRSFDSHGSSPASFVLMAESQAPRCEVRRPLIGCGKSRPLSVLCAAAGRQAISESSDRFSSRNPEPSGAAASDQSWGHGRLVGRVGGRRLCAPGAKRGGFLAEMESLKEEANAAGPIEFEAPLEVVLYPDPRLRAKNKRIDVFDDNLDCFADAMLDAMYRTDGVGLSAPQVGVNVQLMVYNPEGERGRGTEWVLVNPRVTKTARARSVEPEGCLSFPGVNAEVSRPEGVKVEAQDRKGKKFSLSLTGWQARIFLHEYDHLEKTLFFERMSSDVLDAIRPDLLALEEAYRERTGQPPPETVALKMAAA